MLQGATMAYVHLGLRMPSGMQAMPSINCGSSLTSQQVVQRCTLSSRIELNMCDRTSHLHSVHSIKRVPHLGDPLLLTRHLITVATLFQIKVFAAYASDGRHRRRSSAPL